MKKHDPEKQRLIDALCEILYEAKECTQESICHSLAEKGFEVNQSKVSRLLKRVQAVKRENAAGQTVYTLPKEPTPPSVNTPLSELIIKVAANEFLVVITTSPGSASMVARILDYEEVSKEILGTIAGDDTIFVAPKSTKNISSLYEKIRKILGKSLNY